MVNIAINGLGRIGRSVLRALVELPFSDLNIVAANGPASINDHAHLIKYDSLHGTLKQDVKVENDYLLIGNHRIKIIGERDPALLPWKALDIDIVLECTGKFNKHAQAYSHITAGAKKVIVSAPCENADITLICGVNEKMLSSDHQVISVGSCTTNALAPIAKLLNDNVGIEYGFMTTIHSYTNDQNLLDNSHSDLRRARAAALSMIPTSTGAAKTIGVVLPELSGKLAGSAIRVPTPNVSMIDLCFNALKSTSPEDINKIVKQAANTSLKNIISVAQDRLVSIDFNHLPYSSIFDPFETHVVGDKFCRVVSWYDNEWGFSVRMLDVASMLASRLKSE